MRENGTEEQFKDTVAKTDERYQHTDSRISVNAKHSSLKKHTYTHRHQSAESQQQRQS